MIRMKMNAGRGALGAAMLGACLGLCQGSTVAWLPAQLCLVLMAALLQQCEGHARRVAVQAWLFALAYGVAGLIFIPLSLPEHRGWPLVLPLVIVIAAHGGLLAAAAVVIQRLPAAGPWRWVLA